MSRWPKIKVKVRDIATFLKGKKPAVTCDSAVPGAQPYILIESFNGAYRLFTNDNYCVACYPEDTLIVADGANCGLATSGHKGYLGSTLGALRPDTNKIHPRFLFFFIHSLFDLLNTRVRGAAVPHLERDLMLDLELVLPSLPEQERIVGLLDEADQLRRLGTQAKRRSADLIPALFHKMFGDPARNPKRWPLVQVGSFVVRFHAGRSVAPAGEEITVSKNRILKVSAVTWGEFDPKESKPVYDSYIPPPEQFVRSGDLLFSRANTTELVGATVLVEQTPQNLLLPDKLWRFVWKDPTKIEPRFIVSLFQHPSTRCELGNLATGTGGSMKNISMEKLMAMKVPLPPFDNQHAFSVRVSDIRTMGAEQAVSRRRLDDLFQSSLYRAFQGEL